MPPFFIFTRNLKVSSFTLFLKLSLRSYIFIVIYMTTTVFKNGNSLCVRLPKGYELPVGRVHLEKRDGCLVLAPDDSGYPEGFWDAFIQGGDESWDREPQPVTPELTSW